MAREIPIAVNLDQPPRKLPNLAPEENCFTMGDSHGNLLNLIQFLGAVGAITVPDKIYQKIKALYNTSERYSVNDKRRFNLPEQEFIFDLAEKYTNENIAIFRELLLRIEVHPEIFARLIGDIVADRGKFDLFTLLLLEHLQDEAAKLGKPCPFEVLLSNHDLDFIRWCEDGCPSFAQSA